MQRFLVPLFTFIWWNRLKYEHPCHKGYYCRGRVIKVKGWRTALIDGFAKQRTTITFLFGKMNYE